MIAAISWVPKGVAKSVPAEADPPSKEEIEEILKSAADALGKATQVASLGTDDITDGLKGLDMDNYDDEEDGIELFGSGLKDLYYPSNDMDPYLKDKIWILEVSSDGETNMYVHHCNIIPAFPLCTAWLDCPIKGGERGMVLFEFELYASEIFTLTGFEDISITFESNFSFAHMDEVQPSVILGGIADIKRKGKRKSIKYKKDSHSDSVLGLSWNKEYRNILASASADHTVKVWDVTTEACNITMKDHTDKVQAVAWNPFAPQILLSGSFDHTKDGRKPSHSGFKFSVSADVESLAWDPHSEHSFVVSLENGTVSSFDIRAASSGSTSETKPSFTIHAHDKAASSLSFNPLVPNLLATGSTDKTVKLWDLTNNQPSCIASRNPKAGAVFCVSFSDDCPFLLAIGGSKGKLELWDISSEDAVSKKYGKYIAQTRLSPKS
ncbi:hypothetical protein RND71_011056 [Anisodus tanguticus]|uniref:Uncharacterized protein n=1 Tax=Anisodus tanguticus TaxID=243964 RepID=A0AAE1SL07_9SOLA|nr:hypothetical protein RND71_011056 [Anisodus tanguticus]